MVREVRASGSDLDFEVILPTPRHLLDGEGWYDWRVANWGTKWEADGVHREDTSPEQVDYRFSSAWSPPVAIVEALGANFPSLSFHLSYDEPGGGFIGDFQVEEGRVVLDDCRTISEEEYEELYGD